MDYFTWLNRLLPILRWICASENRQMDYKSITGFLLGVVVIGVMMGRRRQMGKQSDEVK